MISWDSPLALSDMPDLKDELLVALAEAEGGDAPELRIQAASQDDYLARQLIAATRVSAIQKNVTVIASTPQGAWADGDFNDEEKS